MISFAARVVDKDFAAASAQEGAVPDVASAWENHVVEAPEDNKDEGDKSRENVREGLEIVPKQCVGMFFGGCEHINQWPSHKKSNEPSENDMPISFLTRRFGEFGKLRLGSSGALRATEPQEQPAVPKRPEMAARTRLDIRQSCGVD
jgi:hypothetical protein